MDQHSVEQLLDKSHSVPPVWFLLGEHDTQGRILLISPPDTSDRFTLGRRKGRLWQTNLGLISLATALMADGWHFSPATQASEQEVLRRIDPHTTVGLSVLPSNYLTGLSLARAAKEWGARAVVLGGPYASSRHVQIVANHPEIDLVVVGPGEDALPRLMRGQPPEMVAGVTYRDSTGMVRTVPRTPLPLSERCVPKRNLWPGPLEEMLMGRPCSTIYWQDGCPIALKEPCIFCTIDHPDRLSRRLPEQAVDEMRQLHSLGFRAIEDGGDDFPSGGSRTVKWLNELATRMQVEGLDFIWLIHATSRGLAYPGMLEALHRVGVRILQIGFESGDPFLKIQLKTSADLEERVLPQIQDLGLKIYGSWVIGMPGEGLPSVQQSVRQIYELYDTGLLCGVLLDPLWPGPGSPAFRQLCNIEPELASRDYIPPEDLLHLWFRHFTRLELDQVLAVREEVLDHLHVPIIGGMLL